MSAAQFHSKKLRIAQIGPSFTHGLSYQENLWAEHLTRRGHSVRVFHAAQATGTLEKINEPYGGFDVQAVAAKFLPRSTFKSSELAGHVRAFNPELIVVHGDKLFAKEVVTDPQLAAVPLIATFSENVGMHEYDWRKPGISLKQRAWAIGFRLLRAGPIRLVCRRATLLIGNSPQARDILLPLFGAGAERQAIDEKLIIGTHGFGPDVFAFRPDVRRKIRAELGVGDADIIVCVSSHFDAAKAPYVVMIIDGLRQVMQQRATVKALIVGFSDSPGTAGPSAQIARHIDEGAFADRFIRAPFADKRRLAELFNASDIAAFGRASISMHESLGTGLVGCFADDGAMSHIVKSQEQAVYFRPGDRDDLASKLLIASDKLGKLVGAAREEHRQHLAAQSRWLGYDQIIARYLNELSARLSK
jgi:hypothetical protein